MIKVLIFNTHIEQISSLCSFLENDTDLNITTTIDSESALDKYLKTKPDIFILDSFSENMSYTELLDRISVSATEKLKCNTLITLDKPEDKLHLVNTAKVYKIFNKPIDLDYLYGTINLMRSEQSFAELQIEEIYILLLQLNLSLTSNGTHYLVSAILQCYYYPDAFSSLDNIFSIVATQHNVSELTVRNAIRSALNKINLSEISQTKNPLLKLLYTQKNITPKFFLEIINTYFRIKKKSKR